MKPSSSTKSFTFLELLLVAFIVAVWYTGVKIAEIVPSQILEFLFSLGLFVVLFLILRKVLFEFTREGHYLFYYRRTIWVLFLAHIGVIYLLRFVFDITPLFAYAASISGVVILPIAGICIYIAMNERRSETTKMEAVRVKQIAMECELARDFVKRFPDCRIFVFDNVAKNRFGKCLFLHRSKRPEGEKLSEDLILEIQVDMKRKHPIASEPAYNRYIFQPEEFGSTVLDLPCPEIPDSSLPLSEMVMNRFNAVLGEYPSLDDVPLPIAARNVPYEVV